MRLSPNGFGGLLLAVSLSACAGNMNAAPVVDSSPSPESQSPSVEPAQPQTNEPALDTGVTSIDAHITRYNLKDTHVKLVDNQGNGFEPLYGTRNVRAVLNGVVYRGGANNSFNKFGKRSNTNPLPTVGLTNLCKEGFSNAVYLYSTNFASAPHALDCVSNLSGAKTHVAYASLNPTSDAGITAILDLVYASIKDPSRGPVYLHCWNGWHASGLASAIVLRQFCGMDATTAQKYWDLNTDGNSVQSSYTSIRQRIRTFVPRTGYAISDTMKREICPQ